MFYEGSKKPQASVITKDRGLGRINPAAGQPLGSDFVLFIYFKNFPDILGFYFSGMVQSYGRKSLEVSVISDQHLFLGERVKLPSFPTLNTAW